MKYTREFEIKKDCNGFKAGDSIKVEMDVDVLALGKALAEKAIDNKSHEATAFFGAIKAKVRKVDRA